MNVGSVPGRGRVLEERPIERYVCLLDARKRQAKVGIIALGSVLALSMLAAFVLLWLTRLRPITGSNVMIVVVLCVYPLFGLVNQLLAYRRTDEMLELLDVLDRKEYRARPAEGHQTVR